MIRPALQCTSIAGASLLCIATATADPDTCAFQELDGIVVVEIESLPETSSWEAETDIPGYTGSAYFRWDGSNQFSNPGVGILTYNVQLLSDGMRQLSIRNRHDDPNDTSDNDVWLRVDGGDWEKVASSGPGTVGVWNWVTTLDEGGPDVILDLTQGFHTIEFSGRSNNFIMDRFHLYELGHPNATNSFAPTSKPCVGINYCESGLNSSGGAAVMCAEGSSSISTNDLVLIASPVPANQNGIFYYGAGPNFDPFGNGTRCVSAAGVGTFRLPFEASGPSGVLTHAIDFGDPPQAIAEITAGSTWYFQAWFRDPPAGGAFFDLSDGYEINFAP